MKIGVTYPQIELNGDPEAVRSIGLAVEELGYDSLLAYDHVVGAEHAGREPELWGPYTESDPFHCPFTRAPAGCSASGPPSSTTPPRATPPSRSTAPCQAPGDDTCIPVGVMERRPLWRRPHASLLAARL